MPGQFHTRRPFYKTIVVLAGLCFILNAVKAAYAGEDKLRPPATKNRSSDRGLIYELEHATMRGFLERTDARNSKNTVHVVQDLDTGGKIYIQAVPGMAEYMFQQTGRHIRGHYAIRPDSQNRTYIYIDQETFKSPEGNGEQYVQHEMDELMAIRKFARDKGWTLDALVRWLDITGEPTEVAKALAEAHDSALELPEGAMEIVGDLTPKAEIFWRAARGAAASEEVPAMNLTAMTIDELKPVIEQKGIDSGFIAMDWNVGKVDKSEDLERINKSVPTINKIFNQTDIRYLYGLTHRGRPKGAGFEDNEKLTLKPVIEKAKGFLAGLDVEIVPLSYDLEKAEQEIARAKEQYKGRKIFFIFENIRFYPAEQAKEKEAREEFENKLIALTGRNAEQLVYISEAFDKAHRGKEASMELVQRLPKENRAAGIALEADLNAVMDFSKGISGDMTVLFGGAKFDKFASIATVSEGAMKQKNGVLLIAGAQANAWEKFANEKETGASLLPNEKETGDVIAAVEKIKTSGVKVLAPVDYRVSLGDLQVNDPQKTLTKEMSQVDIGPETIALFTEHLKSLKAGDGLVLNGGAGMFDALFADGTFALIEEAQAAAERGVSVLFAGGDMDQAAREYERTENKKLNPRIKRTTGGGVVWTIIAKDVAKDPKAMPAIEAVLKETAPTEMNNIEIERFKRADWSVYTKTGGEFFQNYIRKLNDAPYRDEDAGALIITPEVFRSGGINNTLKELELLNGVAHTVIYGEKAEKIKGWIGNKDIITAKTLDEALEKLSNMGITREHTVVLRTERDDIDDAKLERENIRQVVSGEMATIAVAKAVKELFAFEPYTTEAFRSFFESMVTAKVITPLSADAQENILDDLAMGGIFEFPTEVKMTEQVARDTEKARLVSSEFMNRV